MKPRHSTPAPLPRGIDRLACTRPLLATFVALIGAWTGLPAIAQQRPIHYLPNAWPAPGAVGASQIWRGIPAAGQFQQVRLLGPQGSLISIAEDGHFGPGERQTLQVALVVGHIYRLKVSSIPNHEDVEVFPSLEVLNRLCPPPGQEAQFPIPVELTEEELRMAMAGQLVTRVIYLEDPQLALPAVDDPQHQRYFEVATDQNPLLAADRLGRPMAILRMGSRVPDMDAATGEFLFDCPPVIRFQLPSSPTPQAGATGEQVSRGLEPGLEGRIFPRLPAPESSPAPPRVARSPESGRK